MELNASYDIEHSHSSESLEHDMWPLDPIDPKKARFPCCLVWNPLPVVSWLAPFIGHVGICREDGVVLDFSGSNFVNVDDFAFGGVARYLQLDRRQCCFPETYLRINASTATCIPSMGQQSHGMKPCTRACTISRAKLTTSSHATAIRLSPTVLTGYVTVDR